MKLKLGIFVILTLIFVSNCFATIDFDGTDDWLSAGNTNIPTTGDMTIISVANYDVTNTFQKIIGYGNTSTAGWSAGLNSSNRMTFTKHGVASVDASSIGAGPGVWYGFAYRVDVDTSVKFYRYQYSSGAYDTDTSNNTSAINSPSDANIGIGRKSFTLNNDFFNGKISYVCIWPELLSDIVIEKILKSNYKRPYLIAPNSAGCWTLDDEEEGTSADGDIFSDSSGTGNNATGNDGANNTGLTVSAESNLSY